MWNKIKDSRATYIAVSILCAILFWLYVDVTVEPEVKVVLHNIPVTIEGEETLKENGLMILNAEGLTQSVTLNGSRTSISRLNRNNLSISIDAAQITEAGEQEVDYIVNFPTSMSSGLVRIRSSRTLVLNVVEVKSKTVPVKANFTGTVADGYLYDTDDFIYNVKQIQVSGEKSQVDAVDHAQFTLFETNLNRSWTGTIPIELVAGDGTTVDADGLDLSATEVDVTFPISAVKEIPLTVDVTAGGGATEEDVTLEIAPKTITISGTLEDLDEIESLALGSVDLSQVITSESTTFEIKLPEGITNVTGAKTARVTTTINSKLTTQRVDVPAENIRLTKVPKGAEPKVVGKTVSVRIRGSRESMALLVPSDVTIQADLSQLEENASGVCTVKGTVRVRGLSDVGLVGDCVVTVDLG